MTTSLRNKVVVVTGGAKNLGGLISRQLGAAGARVVLHYNSHSTAVEAARTVADIKTAGGEAFAIQADLTRSDEVCILFETAMKTFGSLFASINTVGAAAAGTIVDSTESDFDTMLAVNTKVAYLVMREAARNIDDGGKIINFLTSAVAANIGGYSLYTASKAAVEHYTRALAQELYGRSISVNSIAPGPMDTPFFWDAVSGPEEAKLYAALSMNGQLTKIDDVAPWVRFLLTEGWWLNGQTILLNGGFATR
jgi:NAD(P)-dependent dehydrogenase (short-subunit alcohol dehydrogenase family)